MYDSLLACEREEQSGEAEGEAAGLDRTLSNILVFADDCRTATEWLSSEVVSHDDEQARRAGQRRRHLKERGLLENGKRFVRICGQVVTDAEMIAVMAARQCIDDWDETAGETDPALREVRGRGAVAAGQHRDREHNENAPVQPPSPRRRRNRKPTAGTSRSTWCRSPTRSRRQPSAASGGPPTRPEIDDNGKDTEPGWALNKRAETTVQWLSDAAETVADIAMESESRRSGRCSRAYGRSRGTKNAKMLASGRRTQRKGSRRKDPRRQGPGQSIH